MSLNRFQKNYHTDMKIKYFYINSDVEICVVIGELPKGLNERNRVAQSAIPIKNQKRGWQILYQHKDKTSIKHSEFYPTNYPVVYSPEKNLILN